MHCTASHHAHTPIPTFQHISYAKGKSDAVAKEDGTYKPRMKKQVEEEETTTTTKAAGKKSGTAEKSGAPHGKSGQYVL